MATDTLSVTLSALADPTRRAILARLAEGAATVKELAAPFAISGPAISKHLRVLERAGLITRGREAQWRPCRLEAAPLAEVAEWAEEFRRFWDASYDRLDDYLRHLQREEQTMTTAPKTGETTVTTPSDREVVAARVFEAPRELVWSAYTEPDHLRRWMLGPEGWTMPVCELDLRPGGAYRFVWRKEDGSELTITGVHKEVEPPERLVATESWGDEWPESLNTITFSEEDGRTTITVTMLYPSKEARDAALATGMTDGMNQGYDRLEELLRSLQGGS
jgi:uncharacterized protein YndB with AHSA1/START domain/DNA-binding transcriptional ArsR family regulator